MVTRKRLIICYENGTDEIVATHQVDACSDYQAVQMVAEHHPEIKTFDFDVMMIDVDL